MIYYDAVRLLLEFVEFMRYWRQEDAESLNHRRGDSLIAAIRGISASSSLFVLSFHVLCDVSSHWSTISGFTPSYNRDQPSSHPSPAFSSPSPSASTSSRTAFASQKSLNFPSLVRRRTPSTLSSHSAHAASCPIHFASTRDWRSPLQRGDVVWMYPALKSWLMC